MPVVHKINKIIDATAQELNISTDVVADVIKHTLHSIKEFIEWPTKAGIRLPFFGTFRGLSRSVDNLLILHLIPDLRKARLEGDKELEDKLVTQIRAFWKFRRQIKDDTERRNYKKRYGKWHY